MSFCSAYDSCFHAYGGHLDFDSVLKQNLGTHNLQIKNTMKSNCTSHTFKHKRCCNKRWKPDNPGKINFTIWIRVYPTRERMRFRGQYSVFPEIPGGSPCVLCGCGVRGAVLQWASAARACGRPPLQCHRVEGPQVGQSVPAPQAIHGISRRRVTPPPHPACKKKLNNKIINKSNK